MNKNIKRLTDLLNKRLNRPETAYWHTRVDGMLTANIGHLFMDHNTADGGYRLTEMHNAGGDQCGFGDNNGTEPRKPCKEMVAYLNGVHDSLDVIQADHPYLENERIAKLEARIATLEAAIRGHQSDHSWEDDKLWAALQEDSDG